MDFFIVYSPLLVAMILPLAFILLLGVDNKFGRAFGALFCIYWALRYIYWRYNYSMPNDQEAIQQAWAWVFFTFEMMTILSSCIVFMFMTRTKNRSKDASTKGLYLKDEPTDVFIATYNENYDILERTLVGAKNIRHKDVRVWVLDDGARPWVRTLAEEFGAFYCPRKKGYHAKAGNVNNGLYHALRTGRPPKFILLLDADFVCKPEILERMLPLFVEEDVGIVQSPQHFFNPDPIQTNLLCSKAWPDEQRFFFNELLPSKDAWGTAFCCGTSAIVRVEAALKSNGLATETVTEDMLTSFQFLEHGYRTIFLNERLSLGLAPEGIAEYVSQRQRWCLGAIQQLYTKWAPWGSAKIGLNNRISCADGVLFWVSGYTFKLMMITAPIVYWWTHTAVIVSTVEDMIIWLGPYLVCNAIFMWGYAKNRVIPIMTDVSHLICSIFIVRTIATALIKPFGKSFKVTSKGLSGDKVVIQWNMFLPFITLAILTFLGIIINFSPYSTISGTPGFSINVFWSIFNIFILIIAALICVELPKRRKSERFSVNEKGFIKTEHGVKNKIDIFDMSLGGAQVSKIDFKTGMFYCPELEEGIHCSFERDTEKGMVILFQEDKIIKRKLIKKLYAGPYDNEVGKVRIFSVFISVIKKMFS